MSTDANGAVSLLLYWYVRQPTPIDYNIFVHVIRHDTQELIGQADAPLGQGTHPTSTWRNGEIIFDKISLPKDGLNVQATLIRLGLYQFSSGLRAQIIDSNHQPMG